MPIPAKYSGRCVYHFSHIDNLPSILKRGFVAKNHPAFPKRKVRSVAAESIQERRAGMQVPCGRGGVVHDYVPLYFGAISPMLLAVINARNVDQRDILYFEFPIDLADSSGAVFTDAAANTITPPNFYAALSDLDKLNWELIDSRKWGESDAARKQQRMAELLIHWELPLSAALRCVVLNADAKRQVANLVSGAGYFPPIRVEAYPRYHYYKKRDTQESIVKGPREIAEIFEATSERVEGGRGQNAASAQFANLDALLAALRNDYRGLPHTAELIGLESANAVHHETVDVHTRQVVAKLLSLPEYASLTPKKRRNVELAGHLHDIGKGPKSRWARSGGKQEVDPDHPVGAMPMMEEILTRYVGSVSAKSARRLLKLVCYHDLVGDVLGKGRDRQQIIDVCDDLADLDMLFALGRADASVLSPLWGDAIRWKGLYAKCAAALA